MKLKIIALCLFIAVLLVVINRSCEDSTIIDIAKEQIEKEKEKIDNEIEFTEKKIDEVKEERERREKELQKEESASSDIVNSIDDVLRKYRHIEGESK